MVHFVGAGPGAPDLITVRGAELLGRADIVIYAGSLVNPALLGLCRDGTEIYNSAEMTLPEVKDVCVRGHAEGREIVRLHTGDASIYGAIREQMDELAAEGIPYDNVPGVSSFCGAAAALQAEYTLPGISQSVIITRMAGKTPVPEREALESLAVHGATMVIFLSAGMMKEVAEALLKGAYTESTPAAIVYKATWPEQKSSTARWGRGLRRARRAGFARQRSYLSGIFSGTGMRGVGCMIRGLRRSLEREGTKTFHTGL